MSEKHPIEVLASDNKGRTLFDAFCEVFELLRKKEYEAHIIGDKDGEEEAVAGMERLSRLIGKLISIR